LSFEEYLEETKYTRKTKEFMRMRWDDMDRLVGARVFDKASFVKHERYPGFKYPRGIHACSFEEKCFAGPAVKSVEKAVYSQLAQYFLKGVPTHMKASELQKRLYLSHGLYLGLDVTAWESSITPDIADACEVQLIWHMIGHLDKVVAKFITTDMTMRHKLRYRKFRIKGVTGRMSGDLWTSLANGFTNLMLVKFVCSKLGYDPVGVVEGDDGLFRMDGPVPTKEMFGALGFDSKIEVFTELGMAGFCKMKFSESGTQVTDIIERLTKFGWTADVRATDSRIWSLLFTKALSLKAEYPHCPVLGPFADYVIRVCKASGTKLRLTFDEDRGWNQMKIDNAARWLDVRSDPPLDARLFVERLYLLTVPEQLRLERWFGSLDRIVPIDHPIVCTRLPVEWRQCYDWYVAGGSDLSW